MELVWGDSEDTLWVLIEVVSQVLSMESFLKGQGRDFFSFFSFFWATGESTKRRMWQWEKSREHVSDKVWHDSLEGDFQRKEIFEEFFVWKDLMVPSRHLNMKWVLYCVG